MGLGGVGPTACLVGGGGPRLSLVFASHLLLMLLLLLPNGCDTGPVASPSESSEPGYGSNISSAWDSYRLADLVAKKTVPDSRFYSSRCGAPLPATSQPSPRPASVASTWPRPCCSTRPPPQPPCTHANTSLSEFKNSIGAEYLRRTNLKGHMPTLCAIVKERAAKTDASLLPQADSIVVHLRLGDVVDGTQRTAHVKNDGLLTWNASRVEYYEGVALTLESIHRNVTSVGTSTAPSGPRSSHQKTVVTIVTCFYHNVGNTRHRAHNHEASAA